MLIKNRLSNTTVVFLPGFLGFHQFLGVHYFRKLESTLRHEGVDILFPSTLMTGTVAERAENLSLTIKKCTTEKLILIGHSMGGLDGRFLIHHLDPDHRVQTLITISTPHHGTALAPWILDSPGLFQSAIRLIGTEALRDMTPEMCQIRNREMTNRPDVSYVSYAGKREVRDTPLLLQPFGKILEKEEGKNDGLVSTQSAQWGNFRGTVPADHFELAGWSLALPNPEIQRPFPHITFYANILNKIMEPTEN